MEQLQLIDGNISKRVFWMSKETVNKLKTLRDKNVCTTNKMIEKLIDEAYNKIQK
jgi:hypothetical protein